MALSKMILSAAVLLLGLQAHSQQPPFAVIKDVQIDGSGCDAGSARALITDDLSVMSVLYDRFSVEIGKGTANPGSKAAEKNCAVWVTVQIPANWNFQFESVDYNGFVNLPNKMTVAYQILTAEVQGGRGVAFEQSLMKGPKVANYTTTIQNKSLNAAVNGQQQKPSIGGLIDIIAGLKNKVDRIDSALNGVQDAIGCSDQVREARIKVKATIGVRNLLGELTKPAVSMTIDSTDASFRQNLRLRWKQCR